VRCNKNHFAQQQWSPLSRYYFDMQCK